MTNNGHYYIGKRFENNIKEIDFRKFC